jgi:hypothetical protein
VTPEHALTEAQSDCDPSEVTSGCGRFYCKTRLRPAANRDSVVRRESQRVVRDIVFNVADLLTSDGLRRLWPSLRQTAIVSHSLVREVIKLMVDLCEPLFKSTAKGERRLPKSARDICLLGENVTLSDPLLGD